MPEKSGAIWVPRFPGSTSTADLVAPFRQNAERFIAAVIHSGAANTVTSTRRPRERAFLMHWSWRIVKENADAQSVPAMAGVDIDWWHGTQAASESAALQMVNGYGTGGSTVAPALNSRHIEGNAFDIEISWTGNLSIRRADGSTATITTLPRNGDNTELIAVGATYAVIHFVTAGADRVHWSTDGH